jgi:hypothetical protein
MLYFLGCVWQEALLRQIEEQPAQLQLELCDLQVGPILSTVKEMGMVCSKFFLKKLIHN